MSETSTQVGYLDYEEDNDDEVSIRYEEDPQRKIQIVISKNLQNHFINVYNMLIYILIALCVLIVRFF